LGFKRFGPVAIAVPFRLLGATALVPAAPKKLIDLGFQAFLENLFGSKLYQLSQQIIGLGLATG